MTWGILKYWCKCYVHNSHINSQDNVGGRVYKKHDKPTIGSPLTKFNQDLPPTKAHQTEIPAEYAY